ncbi:hypothetical protein MnBA_27590 [Marinobacterium sp. BA1]
MVIAPVSSTEIDTGLSPASMTVGGIFLSVSASVASACAKAAFAANRPMPTKAIKRPGIEDKFAFVFLIIGLFINVFV